MLFCFTMKLSRKKQTQLPEPGVANTRVFQNIIFESCFHIPQSPFGHVSLYLPCPEIACGTLLLVLPPLVQLMPKTARWCRQIVIDAFLGLVKPHHPRKMRSISSLIPDNLYEGKCLVISFQHDKRNNFVLAFLIFGIVTARTTDNRQFDCSEIRGRGNVVCNEKIGD